MKNISELRQDLVSGDWVVIATGRSKRPNDFVAQKRTPFIQDKKTCPFEKRFSDARIVYAKDGAAAASETSTPAFALAPNTSSGTTCGR